MSIGIVFLSTLLTCIGYGLSFPLFAVTLEATGASGIWIGLNAALPALGWILGSALIPILQLKLQIRIKIIALSFLVLALLGLWVVSIDRTYAGLSIARFLFGGAIGVHLRCIEYIITANSKDAVRARNLAIYGSAFLSGIIVGSAVQPEFGGNHQLVLVAVSVCMALGGSVFAYLRVPELTLDAVQVDWSVFRLIGIFPIAFVAATVFGLYESIPAYLLQIYALRSGLGEVVAAYALSAAALGHLTLLVPVMMLSDKIGRLPMLAVCAVLATIVPLYIDAFRESTPLFLVLIGLWAGAAGSTYGLALAMLGDRFANDQLVVANAVFGIMYAGASVLGPLTHGVAMEYSGSAGAMTSGSALFAVLLFATLITALFRQNSGRGAAQ